MHLLYLDDSGSVGDAGRHFNAAEPHSVELHGSPLLKGSKGWRRHPVPARVQAMVDALTLFAESAGSGRPFAAVVRKDAVFPADPVEIAFERLVSPPVAEVMRC